MTLVPDPDVRGAFHEVRTLGVMVPPGIPEVFAIITEVALARSPSLSIVRIDAPTTASAPRSLARSALLFADRLLSPLLPGSTAPRKKDAHPPLRHRAIDAPPLDPIDAVLIVSDGHLSPLASTSDSPVVWTLQIGSVVDAADGRFGLVEQVSDQPVVMLRLTQTGRGGATYLLAETAVQVHAASPARTRASVLATLPVFLDRAWHLPPGGAATPRNAMEPCNPLIGAAAAARQTARLLGAVIGRLLHRSQWILAAMPSPNPGAPLDWSALRPLIPPPDRFWADPFIVVRDGLTWVFFEEAPFQSVKGPGVGHIAVATINAHGELGPVRRVLDLPWHLSYPNVFEHDGDWYMVPESGSQRRVEVYRCLEWPHVWTSHATLLSDFAGYDASLLDDDGSFWMFVARRAPGASTADLLDVFRADSPLGPWQPDGEVPRIVDVRSARPAGRPFRVDGRWIRPAQDSSAGVYGRALRLQRIEQLEGGYRECTEHLVEPNCAAGVIGIHSFAIGGGVVVVDLCREVSRLPWLRRWTRPMPDRLVSTTWRLNDGL